MHCDTCIWSHLSLDPDSKQSGQMLCKVNPPTPFAVAIPTEQGIGIQVLNLFPTVSKNDSCSFFDDETLDQQLIS